MEDISKASIPGPDDDTSIEEVIIPTPELFANDTLPDAPISEIEEVDVAEEVDIAEDVEVAEDVEIAEEVEIPLAESFFFPEAPTPQPEAPESDPVVLGPAFEDSYIPAELMQEMAFFPELTPEPAPEDLPAVSELELFPEELPAVSELELFPEELAEVSEPMLFPEELVPNVAMEDLTMTAPETETFLPPEEAPVPTPHPRRKGRPARKKGDGLLGLPHLAATAIWLIIILTIGITLGKAMWVCAADVLAFGRENKVVTVTITEADRGNIDVIATKLQEAGLIKYPGVFKVYANLTNAAEEITTGSFQLNTNYDYHALVNGMSPSSAAREVIEVLIPEGYNCRQIFALLEANNVCSVASLEEYAANGEFRDFWFLENVKRGDKYCLEGFLFPDTYEFYINSTPREALGKMLIGFDTRLTDEQIAQLPALNEWFSAKMRENGCSEEFIAQHQIDIRELMIVASLIEEETAGASESPTIASVIYNRLSQDQVYERYLGIDAAIIYATGDASNIDTSIDSPYNTYTHAGLTPTPISNPGLASIEAALKPADTQYYYYVLNPDTEMHTFSKTLEEHEKLVEKYRKAAEAE